MLSTAWRDFRSGLGCRHPCILAAGLVLFSVGCLVLEWAGRTGAFTAIPETLWLRHRADLFTHVGYTVGKLKREPPEKAVYFVGGSAMAYAVRPSSFVARALTEGALRVEAHNFGIGRQPMGEALAIVDNLPAGDGLVVLGVNPRVLSRPLHSFFDRWRHRHLPLRSPALNAFLRREGRGDLSVDFLLPSLVWRLKHQVWFRLNGWARGTLETGSFTEPWYERPPLPPEKKSRKIRDYVSRCREHFARDFGVNLRAAVALSEVARGKGLSVAWLELPMNPEARRLFGERFLSSYRGEVEKAAAALKVPYWKPSALSSLEDHDFVDAVHVLQSGRGAYEPEVTRRVIAHFLRQNRIAGSR